MLAVLAWCSPAGAQGVINPTRVQTGDGTLTLPGLTFSSDTDTGIYRIGSNNLGVVVGGTKILDISASGLTVTGSNIFSTIQVGNNSPALTSPTRFFSFNHAYTGALGATATWGGDATTRFTSSNAWSGGGVGFAAQASITGSQNATGDVYALYANMSTSTSGNVTKIEGNRSAVQVAGSTTTDTVGYGTYTAVTSGSSATNTGLAVYTGTISGGAAVTTNLGARIYQPPQSGGTLAYNRAIEIDNQSTPLTANSLAMEYTGPTSSYYRLWASGKSQSYVSSAAATLEDSVTGVGSIAGSHAYDYTGGDLSTNRAVIANYGYLGLTPSANLTQGYPVALEGELETYGTYTFRSAVGVSAYAEANDSSTATGFYAGLDAEYGHYSSATVPRVAAIETSGGVGSGTATLVSDIWIDSMWDTAGTTTERRAIDINPVTEGATNWALHYTNTNSQVAGLTGGGALVDAPGTQTVADSGDGSPATATLTPTTSLVKITCSDADGCTETLGESGVVDGQIARLINVSANVCNFSDTSGVSELAGSFAMGQWDSLTIQYVTDRWVELSRSNN